MKHQLLVVAVFLSLFSLFSHQVKGEEKRLIELSPFERVWMTLEEIDEMNLKRHQKKGVFGVGYFDVTDFFDPSQDTRKRMEEEEEEVPYIFPPFPREPAHQETIKPLLSELSKENLRSMVTSLSSFPNRFYNNPSGGDASRWLAEYLNKMIESSGRKDAECTIMRHAFAQGSVICNLEGSGEGEERKAAEEIVILGAHLDSINSLSVPNGTAPGADDDASGVSSFVEVFRVLLTSGFRPKRSMQFIAYAAQEVGLRGSQEVARVYKRERKPVYAAYQNEMSGYPGQRPNLVIFQDFVHPELTRFLEVCAREFVPEVPVAKSICGYACSDHASWTKEGIPSVCTSESDPYGDVNPYMHTENDTVDHLDFDLLLAFTKLALAFAVELALV